MAGDPAGVEEKRLEGIGFLPKESRQYPILLRMEETPGRSMKTFQPVQIVTSTGENQVLMELGLKNGRILRLYREMPVAAMVELAHGLESEAC